LKYLVSSKFELQMSIKNIEYVQLSNVKVLVRINNKKCCIKCAQALVIKIKHFIDWVVSWFLVVNRLQQLVNSIIVMSFCLYCLRKFLMRN